MLGFKCDFKLLEQIAIRHLGHCTSCRMGVANRDIKLENILLKGHYSQPILKICDFGYSINENHSLPKTALGTPGYTGVPKCVIGSTVEKVYSSGSLVLERLEFVSSHLLALNSIVTV